MICHQHIGADFTSALTRILMKPIQIVEAVYSVIETDLPIIAAVYYMKGDVRWYDKRSPRFGSIALYTHNHC